MGESIDAPCRPGHSKAAGRRISRPQPLDNVQGTVYALCRRAFRGQPPSRARPKGLASRRGRKNPSSPVPRKGKRGIASLFPDSGQCGSTCLIPFATQPWHVPPPPCRPVKVQGTVYALCRRAFRGQPPSRARPKGLASRRGRKNSRPPSPRGFGRAPRGTAVPLSSGRGVQGDRSPARFLWYRQRHLSFQRKVGLRELL